ncbi:MAG: hypothetical protein HKP03_06300 [Xanthomonadales bacterium]|nr:hypothetical protein [Xanthomonadales bacterium]
MDIVVALVGVVSALLYLGQLVSSVNFPLAQRLGLQEKPEAIDPLTSELELRTARWDLPTLWVAPVACGLFLVDHAAWPVLALIGGGIYVDCGGRELSKFRGLAAQGVRIGSDSERRLFSATCVLIILVGLFLIWLGAFRAT